MGQAYVRFAAQQYALFLLTYMRQPATRISDRHLSEDANAFLVLLEAVAAHLKRTDARDSERGRAIHAFLKLHAQCCQPAHRPRLQSRGYGA
jgi:hypothetical protein